MHMYCGKCISSNITIARLSLLNKLMPVFMVNVSEVTSNLQSMKGIAMQETVTASAKLQCVTVKNTWWRQ